ncbi:hypothetical protein BLNAU_13311 [Blattamonas nauphoetae]|uniref:Uncharacterized protein n=1 Tax=Blattamonas nauphoetae TaxID=2049346 RepID=A0ABQ9XLJ4_9EUKA|nr:hypothetical protein BLNAU_13311 [Blattamonas nauphoetae]
MTDNFATFSESLGKDKFVESKSYFKPQEVDDSPIVEHPIEIKVLWKHDRTLRLDFSKKILQILDGASVKTEIAGPDLKRIDQDKKDDTAISITHLTKDPKKPEATIVIFAPKASLREIILRDLSDYLRSL